MSTRRSPTCVFHWRDAQPTGAEGWVVLDSIINGVSGGGIFMHKQATLQETQDIAHNMSKKFTVTRPQIGGAKAGIRFDETDPRARQVLRRFLVAHATLLNGCWVTAGDMNTSDAFIEQVVQEDLGLPTCQYALGKQIQLAGGEDLCAQLRVLNALPACEFFPLVEGAVGYGLTAAVDFALQLRRESSGEQPLTPRTSELPRVAIQGFGAVGSSLAHYLTARCIARVVAIADKDCFVYDACNARGEQSDGLPVEEFLQARKQRVPQDPGAGKNLLPLLQVFSSEAALDQAFSSPEPNVLVCDWQPECEMGVYRRRAHETDEAFFSEMLARCGQVEVLCPCAGRYQVTEHVAELALATCWKDVRHPVLAAGANNCLGMRAASGQLVQDDGRVARRLRLANVCVVPDYVCNAGTACLFHVGLSQKFEGQDVVRRVLDACAQPIVAFLREAYEESLNGLPDLARACRALSAARLARPLPLSEAHLAPLDEDPELTKPAAAAPEPEVEAEGEGQAGGEAEAEAEAEVKQGEPQLARALAELRLQLADVLQRLQSPPLAGHTDMVAQAVGWQMANLALMLCPRKDVAEAQMQAWFARDAPPHTSLQALSELLRQLGGHGEAFPRQLLTPIRDYVGDEARDEGDQVEQTDQTDEGDQADQVDEADEAEGAEVADVQEADEVDQVKEDEVQQEPQPEVDVQQRLASLLSIGQCVERHELETLLRSGKRFVVYDGFEPSGRMHVAQCLMKTAAVNKVTQAGGTFVLWIADIFAKLNQKQEGDMQRIRLLGEYFIEIWKASAMDLSRVRFVWATEAISKNPMEYLRILSHIATKFTLTRLRKCMTALGKSESDDALKGSAILYAMMQCTDIFFLNVDICQLGMDQLKVNMLARDFVDEKAETKQDGFRKPIVLSHAMLPGLKRGQEKMSKSDPDSAIFMCDDAQTVARKIAASFCAPCNVQENPCLAYMQHIVYAHSPEGVVVGHTCFPTFEALRDAFAMGTVHPAELKASLTARLNQLMEPVRRHFESDPHARSLLERVRALPESKKK